MTLTTERAAVYTGPAAYRVTPNQVNAQEGPYLGLECPHEPGHDESARPGCERNLLHASRRHLAGVELGTLVMAALYHDDRHTGTDTTEAPEPLREQIAALGEYRLYPDVDEQPFLVLNCPYLKPAARRCPDTVDGECVANLLPDDQALTGVPIGILLARAAEHEDARTRWLAEAFGTGAYAQLVGRINALRLDLAKRQQTEIYTRESADGPSAGLASSRADVYGQLLAELDQAVNGG